MEYDIPLERDVFLRDLLRNLSGTLEDVIGIDEASGFISIVGQKMGDDINALYKDVLNTDSLNRSQVSSVLADLKQRIQGDFIIESEDDEKIVKVVIYDFSENTDQGESPYSVAIIINRE